MEDNSAIDVKATLFEYNEKGEKVAEKAIDCYDGLSNTFIAKPDAEKVKVYIVMESKLSISKRWVQEVFYLTEGKNIDIELKGTTELGTKEP